MKKKDLIGQRFGRLVVKEEGEKSSSGKTRWICECDCGKTTLVCQSDLLRKDKRKTESCGCIQKERTKQASKKYNKYNLNKNYGIGYCTNTGSPFYFDLEDYKRIKDYCWREEKQGYISACINGKIIKLHKLITNSTSDRIIDHFSRNKADCRKENLRIATKMQNCSNRSIGANNSSKFIGVHYNTKINKWVSQIAHNKKNFYLGSFKDIEDAIKVRLKAELKYFGEFSPQRHLFKKYGITEESLES